MPLDWHIIEPDEWGHKKRTKWKREVEVENTTGIYKSPGAQEEKIQDDSGNKTI